MKFVARDLGSAADISRGGLSLSAALKTGLAIGLALVAAYFTLGLLGESLAGRLPVSDEARLFADLSLPGSEPLPDDVPGALQARQALARLLTTPDLPALPYRLFLLPTELPNAFALPGGAIGITRGLLEQVDTEIGLAFVLGHELGHHAHRHALRRLGRVLSLQLLIALLFGGDLHPALSSIEHLAASSYSRAQEHEADSFALNAVFRNYGTLDGAFVFFEKMLAREGDDADLAVDQRLSAFAASHPLTRERLARLKTAARAFAATP